MHWNLRPAKIGKIINHSGNAKNVFAGNENEWKLFPNHWVILSLSIEWVCSYIEPIKMKVLKVVGQERVLRLESGFVHINKDTVEWKNIFW